MCDRTAKRGAIAEPCALCAGLARVASDFIGIIIVRYAVEPAVGGHLFRRTPIDPARPKAPTAVSIARTDDEATVCLLNIKRAVEARVAARSADLKP